MRVSFVFLSYFYFVELMPMLALFFLLLPVHFSFTFSITSLWSEFVVVACSIWFWVRYLYAGEVSYTNSLFHFYLDFVLAVRFYGPYVYLVQFTLVCDIVCGRKWCLLGQSCVILRNLIQVDHDRCFYLYKIVPYLLNILSNSIPFWHSFHRKIPKISMTYGIEDLYLGKNRKLLFFRCFTFWQRWCISIYCDSGSLLSFPSNVAYLLIYRFESK